MKQSTMLLKGAILLLAFPVLILAAVGIPWLLTNPANPDLDHILYPIVIGLYLSVLPFLYGLMQSYFVLNYIEKDNAFSKEAVTLLKRIKYSALAFSGIFTVILPFIFMLAEIDDAPGLVIVGALPVFASFVLATLVAVLQELFEKAIELKEENKWTI
ncbi:DUF2975 domain-containing protein [Alkalibacterium sp. MB6]|uniref:DUF2975 domain-containing protein n=1 Tax=Alkalibacterium sp. MB6 TaxID=2081965 RepID=UPI00137B1947|nr:DUF2975 domain-containing protein [Alkalibacterium sp. MB6]